MHNRIKIAGLVYQASVPVPNLKLARCQRSLGATHRAFTFYLGNPFPRFLCS